MCLMNPTEVQGPHGGKFEEGGKVAYWILVNTIGSDSEFLEAL